MRTRLLPFVLSLSLTVSACTNTEGGKQTNEAIGGIMGLLLGQILGRTIGSGSGKDIAQSMGAIAGFFAGRELARSLTEGDIDLFDDTVDDSLENDESGEISTWENPDSGNSGSVTPTSETYETVENSQCREFESTVVVDGQVETANGHACRQADGSWKIVQ